MCTIFPRLPSHCIIYQEPVSKKTITIIMEIFRLRFSQDFFFNTYSKFLSMNVFCLTTAFCCSEMRLAVEKDQI